MHLLFIPVNYRYLRIVTIIFIYRFPGTTDNGYHPGLPQTTIIINLLFLIIQIKRVGNMIKIITQVYILSV